MKKTSLCLITIIMLIVSCRKNPQYPNTQTEFADDPNFRLGKWYSVTDSGTTSQTANTTLDTIWFINDTLAGWTGFVPYHPHAYAFFKTYISPQSIYYIVYIVPDPYTIGQMDTAVHQFGFTPTGDTMGILWNPATQPPQWERYVKMK